MALKSSAYMVRFPFKIALKVVAGIPAFAATAICLYPFSFMCLFIVISSVLGFISSQSYTFTEIKMWFNDFS